MTSRKVLLPLLLVACDSRIDGLWIFQLGDAGDATTSATCKENFERARCAGASGQGDDDWTITERVDVTPSLVTGEMVDGYARNPWLVWKGKIIPLDMKGSTLTGLWAGSTETAREEEHVSGYDWKFDESGETRIELLLQRASRHVWTGRLREVLDSTRSWAESDEWNASRVGFAEPRISVFSEANLVHSDGGTDETGTPTEDEGTVNLADGDDCDGSMCTGTLSVTADTSWIVTAEPTRGDDEPGASTYAGAETPPGGGWTLRAR